MRRKPQMRINRFPIGAPLTRSKAAETLWLSRRTVRRIGVPGDCIYIIRGTAVEIHI